MKPLLVKLRNLFIKFKVYISRTTGYLSLVNATMILFLFLSNLEKYGVDLPIEKLMVPLILAGALFMIAFGYLEDRFGFYRQEQKTTQSRSPYFRRILKKLDELDNKISKLEKKVEK